MLTKISGVILTKDEGKNLSECIKSIKYYLDEIVVIDSSATDIDMQNAAGCRYFSSKMQSFADLRNCGNQMATNDWVLHVDVDEIFSSGFFRDADVILKDTKASAYAFPRINLPFYELYPDYQVRLVHRKNTMWYGGVHEKVQVLTDPKNVINLDMFPIVHKNKTNKIEVNKRWDAVKKYKNVIICTLFRDCEPFMDKFLDCLSKMIEHTSKQGHIVDLCIIEGNSKDNTYLKLKHWLLSYKYNYTFKKIEISTEISRFERLAVMRNMLLKFGLKNYHDYLLMIDSDTIFSETLFDQLYSSLETNKCNAVAPLIYIEESGRRPANYFYDSLAYIGNDGEHFKHQSPYYTVLTSNSIAEMKSVGTCYLVRAQDINLNDVKDYSFTQCYETNKNKVVVIYEGVWENAPISEQTGFFLNLKKKDPGVKIIVDSKIIIYHVDLEKFGLKWH